MSHILVAEDETGIAEFLKRGFLKAGYECTVVDNGPAAFAEARRGNADLLVLDLGLPHMDGADVLEDLRALHTELPIIVLTARTGLNDRLRVLQGGADDYMAKPFLFAELLARVELRLAARTTHASHGAQPEQLELSYGAVLLDLRTHQARVGDEASWIELSRREYSLLETFLSHPEQVLSRAQLLEQVWDMDFDPGSNVVDVYIRTLRKKIGAERIVTVRGSGYRFTG